MQLTVWKKPGPLSRATDVKSVYIQSCHCDTVFVVNETRKAKP